MLIHSALRASLFDRVVFTGLVMLSVSTAPSDASKNFRGGGHDPYPAAKGARTQKCSCESLSHARLCNGLPDMI